MTGPCFELAYCYRIGEGQQVAQRHPGRLGVRQLRRREEFDLWRLAS
jgi:hypothetical protein